MSIANKTAEQLNELAAKLVGVEGWVWVWVDASEISPISTHQYLLPPDNDPRRNWCACWVRIPDTTRFLPHWAELKESPTP